MRGTVGHIILWGVVIALVWFVIALGFGIWLGGWLKRNPPQ